MAREDAVVNTELTEAPFEVYTEDDPDIPEEFRPQEAAKERDYEREVAELKEQLARVTGGETSKREVAEAIKGVVEEQARARMEEQKEQGVPKAQRKTLGELKKELSKKFFSDPTAAMEEYVEAYVAERVAPAFKQLYDQVLETGATAGQSAAVRDEQQKFIMEKYGAEVQTAYRKNGGNYQAALRQVTVDHVDDVVKFRLEQSGADVGSSGGSEGGGADPRIAGQGRNVNPEGAGKPKRRGVVLSRGDRERLQQEANEKGLEFQAYVSYLERKGKLKRG